MKGSSTLPRSPFGTWPGMEASLRAVAFLVDKGWGTKVWGVLKASTRSRLQGQTTHRQA